LALSGCGSPPSATATAKPFFMNEQETIAQLLDYLKLQQAQILDLQKGHEIRLRATEETQKGQEERLRATENAVIKLTWLSEQAAESAKDREKRIRELESQAKVPVAHDGDHESRLERLESLSNSKPQAAIIANLSVRELVFIGLAFAGFITGKWDWLVGVFSK
jgi:hypothetical protein